MIRMDAESSRSPPHRQVALLPASIRSVPAASTRREGLEGPSLTRLREAPRIEIFKSSQDDSRVTTSRRPVLHWRLCTCAHPRLQESGLLTAAPNGDGKHLFNHSRCAYQTGLCDITKPLPLGPPSPNAPKDVLLQTGFVQGPAAKAGINPTFPSGSGHKVSCLPLPKASRCPWARQQPGSRDRTVSARSPCSLPGYAAFQH